MIRFRPASSKSELIRGLILQSYSPSLVLKGQSECDDVRAVRRALDDLSKGRRRLDLGDSGLGFRSMALRASRTPGPWSLTGSESLMKRPQQDLVNILNQLGCKAEWSPRELTILSPESGQWRTERPVQIPGHVSSQFVSSVLLNAFNLNSTLHLCWLKPHKSQGYVQLTLKLLKQVGARIETNERENDWTFHIEPSVLRADQTLSVESDYSTAFAAAVFGLSRDGVIIEGLEESSLQPDKVGLSLLASMGVSWSWNAEGELFVPSTKDLVAVDFDASGAPDLAPVFSVLAAHARGPSVVHNAPHLRHKESDRIFKAVQMARFLGAEATELDDGFRIVPQEQGYLRKRGTWSCDHDHRQAMAGLAALAFGHRFEIDGLDTITKSAPELLDLARDLKIATVNPKRILIGHRGVGKTTVAKSLAGFDLDEQIQNEAQCSILNYFQKFGEDSFRIKEQDVLDQLMAKECSPIALGAGFVLDKDLRTSRTKIHSWKDYRKLWIQRASDQTGRIFVDRPRLNPSLAPLEEFEQRHHERSPRYKAAQDQTVLLPEGFDTAREGGSLTLLKTLVFGNPDLQGASLTVPSEHLKSLAAIESYLDLRQNWRLSFFEIREDLLDPSMSFEELAAICQLIIRRVGAEHVLWSRRVVLPSAVFQKLDQLMIQSKVLRDLDTLCVSQDSTATTEILSSHGPTPPIGASPVFLKWSPVLPVESAWNFLQAAHRWWLEDPANRVVLPRTDPRESFPRWTWYRLLTSRKLKPRITFVREDEGSSLDQPTLLEWLFETHHKAENLTDGFGAVLGDPVHLSQSPQTHGPGFFAIPIKAEDFNVAMNTLEHLGLNRAAVTSPLKPLAYAWLLKTSTGPETVSPAVARLEALNTLLKHEGKWFGENTDLPGFKDWVHSIEGIDSKAEVVLWGGGGTVGIVKDTFPQAITYSARTGEQRPENEPSTGFPQSMATEGPTILVWAVGRSQFNGQLPPGSWQPRWILDLNYTEGSPGREYALKRGLLNNYVSGLDFFRKQAEFQKLFWKRKYASK